MKKTLVLTLFAAASLLGVFGISDVSAASPAKVDIASAGNYVILAKTAITTTGVTSITGDIGISPAFEINMTGFGFVLDGSGTYSTSALITGKAYAADYTAPTPATLTTAILDMQNAYTDANSRAVDVTDAGAGDLAGLSLVAGTYFFSGPGNVIITDDVTLSGSATDVWIFQIPGTLDLSAAKKIILTGGALPENIFWAVAGTTTLEPGSTFEGIILGGPGASTIAGQNGAILHGRALGQTDVTLIANNISIPAPVVVPVVVTPVASSGGSSSSGGRFMPVYTGIGPSGYGAITTTVQSADTLLASAATMVVTPSFPNAGIMPDNYTMWHMLMISGLFLLVSIPLVVVLLGVL
ncbi:MAG: ice-binding family protein [Minisyncoccia bacterium]